MYHFLVSCVIRKTKFDIQIQDSFMNLQPGVNSSWFKFAINLFFLNTHFTFQYKSEGKFLGTVFVCFEIL